MVCAALANIVACAALEIRVVLQMVFLSVCIIRSTNGVPCGLYNPCVRLVKHRQQKRCIKLEQTYENSKQLIHS